MYLSALLLGLLGSFHCIGMCGPIALVLPIHQEKPIPRLLKIFLYHSGRLLAYGSIGLFFGIVGKGLYLSGFQQRLSIIIGVFMIVYILIPYKTIKKLNFTSSIFSLVSHIKTKLGQRLQNKGYRSLFIIGFLNGYLPCGMVYMALAGAIATGTPSEGFLYMFIYGLGTIPLLTLLIYFKNTFSISVRNKIQKAIPYFIFLIGLMFILRGMGIGIPYISPSNTNLQINSTPANCSPSLVN